MILRFGAFEFDDDARELRHAGKAVALQPKPFELLALLIRERGRIVSHDELLDALWPDATVAPGSLTRAVSLARRAISDTKQGNAIRSFPRRGYRFCADVVVLGERGGAPPASTGTASGTDSFVGRDKALRAVRDAWERSATGQGQVAIVRGRAGIGKTRLTEVLSTEFGDKGARVILARARDSEGVPAFWVWAQVLRTLLEDPQLSGPIRELEREMAHRIPELGEKIERNEVGAAGNRFLLFDAVARVLVRASRERPLLLIIEDLQWVRDGSLRLLEHVTAEISNSAVLLIATVRDEPRERAHPLHRTLALLQQMGHCATVTLGSLSRKEVGDLLRQSLGANAPADLTSELFVRTEGVPLFLREAIRWLADHGDFDQPEAIGRLGVILPDTSLDLIRRPLNTLGAACSELVCAAAVIGREFSVPTLASVADCTRGDALELLDEAVCAGIVEPIPDDAVGFRFLHALFQEAAREALPAAQRARLHFRTAARLEQQHAGDLDRVMSALAHHHYHGMAVGDPERTLTYSLRAAELAQDALAFEQAAVHYERAIQSLDQQDTIDPEHRLRVLLALGDAHRAAGERAGRRMAYLQAQQTAKALDRPADFARAAIGLCDLSEWAIRDQEAEAAVVEAIDWLGDAEPVLRAQLTTRRAYIATQINQTFEQQNEAESLARTAVEQARAAGDPDALQEALYALHLILSGPDHFDERRALTLEMAEVAPRSNNLDPVVIGLIDVSCDRLALGDTKGQKEFRDRALELIGENGLPSQRWHLNVYAAGCKLLAGRFDEVLETTQDAFALGQRIEHPYAFGCYIAHRLGVMRERGEYEAQISLLQQALEFEEGPVHWIRALLGQAELRRGQPDAAREHFEILAVDPFRDIPRSIRWTNTIQEIALLCAELGDAERAAPLCGLLEPVAHHHALFPTAVLYGGPVSYGLARLYETQSRIDDARDCYAAAIEAATLLEARPVEARIRFDLGAMELRHGSPSDARAQLESAFETGEALGLTFLVERAKATLAPRRSS